MRMRYLNYRQLACTLILALTVVLPEGVFGRQAKPAAWNPAILEKDSASKHYLPDFSFAGYRWGEERLPDSPATMFASDFGVKPDDGIDDTAGLQAAMNAAHATDSPVVLALPAGRLILQEILYIKRSHFVIRGGKDGKRTTIAIAKPMSEMVFPEAMTELRDYLIENDKRVKSGQPFSPFSWTGGVIWARNAENRVYPYLRRADRSPVIVSAVDEGRRGRFEFMAANPENIKIGSTLKLLWYNRDGAEGSLIKHLYGAYAFKVGSRHWENPDRSLIEQFVTIRGVDGNRVTIKEPLLHDLNKDWATVLCEAPMLQEVGIENLDIEFPVVDYSGHHLEGGYNAIYLTSLAHSWVRNVNIMNADNAILSDGSAYVTLDGLRISGRSGHYGIHIGKTNHMLAKNIEIDAEMEHSLSFNSYARAGVFTNAVIRQRPTLDQHCGSNHQNLFDNIRIENLKREDDIFKHGGAGYWKPTHGLYNTFWHLQLQYGPAGKGGPMAIVEVGGIDDGPQARFVGMVANLPLKLRYGPDVYQEGTNRTGIAVPSLYEYQLQARLRE